MRLVHADLCGFTTLTRKIRKFAIPECLEKKNNSRNMNDRINFKIENKQRWIIAMNVH